LLVSEQKQKYFLGGQRSWTSVGVAFIILTSAQEQVQSTLWRW